MWPIDPAGRRGGEEHELGRPSRRGIERFFAALCFEDREAGSLERLPDPGAEKTIVIHDENAFAERRRT